VYGLFPATCGAPEGLVQVWLLISAMIIFGGSLYAQVWRYRHYSSPTQKQQAKWLIYALGLIASLIVPTYVGLVMLALPTVANSGTGIVIELLYFSANLIMVLLPIAIGVSILRYRLWDIDIIIRKTLTYAIVVAILATIYLGSVVLLQQIFATVSNQRSDVVTVLSTLAIAALFVPVRNWIQALVDRRFYRSKYDAQQILNQFGATVRDETDLEALGVQLIEVVNETVKPARATLWLKSKSTRANEPDSIGAGLL